jgi:hypothetical protein
MEHGQPHAWADFNPAVAGFNFHKMTMNLDSELHNDGEWYFSRIQREHTLVQKVESKAKTASSWKDFQIVRIC